MYDLLLIYKLNKKCIILKAHTFKFKLSKDISDFKVPSQQNVFYIIAFRYYILTIK